MTDLGPILERLGLDQYLDAFLGEGFDTWETVLDVQESDLDALNVKLGHRRKLQREIANYRGISYERLISSPAYESSLDIVKSNEGIQTPTASTDRSGASGETKRKYRRHPKPDENAPERPPSAYVIFSNRTREEVKGENLSFTAIAKLVGDRWQKLEPADKEPFEGQAAAAKERYNIELAAYKQTDEYREYMSYLADFKAKHAPTTSESKRPKLDKESSGGSVSVRSLDMSESMTNVPGHVRIGSVGSMSTSSYTQALPSPIGQQSGLGTYVSTAAFGPASSRLTSASPQMASPQGALISWDSASRAPLSSRSSVSDESAVTRSEHPDPLPRTSQLSLATTSTTGASYFALTESISGTDTHRRSGRSGFLQQESFGAVGSSSLPARFIPGVTSSVTPPMSSDEYWRSRGQDAASTASRTYPELARPLHPPIGTASNVPYSSLPFPPMISTERLPDLAQDQSHRLLPPPMSSQQSASQHGLRAAPPAPSTPRPAAGERGLTSPWPRDDTSTPLDTSESAAISTLASLSSNPSRSESTRPRAQESPPPR